MIVHGLENANMPTVWQDWDMEKGSVRDHKRRQTRVILEMLLMMVVRAAFHTLFLLPIIFTGEYQCILKYLTFLFSAKNVWERHELLENTIGVLPDEKQSYDNVNTIFYVVVGLIPTLTLLEIVLYCLYQCKVRNPT